MRHRAPPRGAHGEWEVASSPMRAPFGVDGRARRRRQMSAVSAETSVVLDTGIRDACGRRGPMLDVAEFAAVTAWPVVARQQRPVATLASRVPVPSHLTTVTRAVCGMSAHFRAWPRCINMQAEQPVAIAIGACAPATGEAKATSSTRNISLCADVGWSLTKDAVRPDMCVLHG
jgi:hypothetical protein